MPYVLIILVLAALCLLAVEQSNDCTNRGGSMQQEGFVDMWITTDASRGAGFISSQPNYVCKDTK
jgi:hypothetical protein